MVTLGGRFGGLAHVARHWWWANTPIGEGVRMEKGGVYMWIAREGPIWCGRGLKWVWIAREGADSVRSRAEMNLDSTNKAVSVRLEGGFVSNLFVGAVICNFLIVRLLSRNPSVI